MVGCFRTRLGASAVLAGLDPALHAVPLRDGARARHRLAQGAKKQRFLVSPSAGGRSLRRTAWVAGSSPAMTLPARLAPLQHSQFQLPTADAIRNQSLVLVTRIPLAHVSVLSRRF